MTMISRRGFVAGLGGLITGRFIRRVQRYVEATQERLWVTPRAAVRSLYLWRDGVEPDGSGRYLITDGPREVLAPLPPRWFDHLAGRGSISAARPHGKPPGGATTSPTSTRPCPRISGRCGGTGPGPRLSAPPLTTSPGLAIGPTLGGAAGAPALTLVDGFSPICTCPMAFLNGAVAVSLLQARLVEPGEPTALLAALCFGRLRDEQA